MAQVEDWLAIHVNLVEDVVAEELDDIALAVLAPFGVAFVLGALIDGVELGEEADETAVLELAH